MSTQPAKAFARPNGFACSQPDRIGALKVPLQRARVTTARTRMPLDIRPVDLLRSTATRKPSSRLGPCLGQRRRWRVTAGQRSSKQAPIPAVEDARLPP